MEDLERFMPDPGADRELSAQHMARYEFAAGRCAGKSVVDVACGTGYGSSLLARGGALSVIGIDRSEAAIEHARERYAGNGATFLLGDVSLLREVRSAGCVVSFETIEHLEDAATLLEPAAEILGGDGLFIVSTPVRRGGSLTRRPDNPFHVREWNPEEFDDLLSLYFTRRRMYFQYVYRKRPFPLSRTLNRLAIGSFYRRASAGFEGFPVVESRWDIPGALVERGFMVAVCSGRPD